MTVLNNVTLLIVEPLNPDSAAKVLDYCQREIKFGEIQLHSSEMPNDYNGRFIKIPKFNWSSYNDYILNINQFINTDFCMTVQLDGFIINPQLWKDEFLQYDYIGAPWPSDPEWRQRQLLSLRDRYNDNNRVGNGGFSLRSKKFLELSSDFPTCFGAGEDQFLCVEQHGYMAANGIKFAPPEIAVKFSVENPVKELGCNGWQDVYNPNFNTNKSFGWHGKVLPNHQELMNRIYQ